ncbi:MAG: type II secretion system F family protein [Paraburkholderia sp.]|uniref:type II secretion system F family protein n=1 Tax=Paraburkholderia sp. TaxID=1926495 RepID=UPI0011FE08E9|nr:type II secretion system F family protein [Paraburkholderia sp.]TAM06963.1 MAG: type II secretion system F family protein [Paraburkholderia sp.]TAM31969.1 MAG: type II secretion system F family protein [Paraburkholderia sp.]
MNTLFYGFVILVFVSIILLIEAGYFWWKSGHSSEAKRLENRIRMMSAGGHGNDRAGSILKQRELSSSPLMSRLLLKVPRIHALDRWLVQSGLNWSVGKFVMLMVCPPVVIALLGRLVYIPAAALVVLMLIGALYAPFRVNRAMNKRLKRLEEQLPEAADMMSRSLRAGHSFATALGIVGDEMPEPIGGEFRAAFDEINFGVPLNQALGALASRVPISDLRYFVIAVLIQRESGGNLAEILGNISQLIRSRLALLGKVKALSAEGRLSAWILGLLPFGLGMVISLVNPGFMKVLWTDPAGLKMVGGAVVLMLFGFVWMRKVIRIHV